MDRQLTKVGVGEFAATAPANPGIDLEGLFPVALLALFGVAAGFGHYPVQLSRVARCHNVLLLPRRRRAGQRHGSRTTGLDAEHATAVTRPDILTCRAQLGGCADRKSTRLNSSHRCISYAV